METTKMTVRVPKPLLEQAKRYAQRHETTLTRLIITYLSHLESDQDSDDLSPAVKRVSGSLSQDVSLEDYRQFLDKKYGSAT